MRQLSRGPLGGVIMKISLYILSIMIVLATGCTRQKVQTETQKNEQDSNRVEDKVSYINTEDPSQKYIIHKINPSLPSFRFDLYADSAFAVVDSIEISSTRDSSVIQTIVSELHDQPFIVFQDYNFDEYEDLVLACCNGPHGNMSYDIWLYDTVKNKFVNNIELSNLVNPDVNYEKETIVSNWSGGRYFHSHLEYKLNDEHLTLVEEKSESPIVNTNIAVKIECKLQNGKMDTVRRDTVKMEE